MVKWVFVYTLQVLSNMIKSFVAFGGGKIKRLSIFNGRKKLDLSNAGPDFHDVVNNKAKFEDADPKKKKTIRLKVKRVRKIMSYVTVPLRNGQIILNGPSEEVRLGNDDKTVENTTTKETKEPKQEPITIEFDVPMSNDEEQVMKQAGNLLTSCPKYKSLIWKEIKKSKYTMSSKVPSSAPAILEADNLNLPKDSPLLRSLSNDFEQQELKDKDDNNNNAKDSGEEVYNEDLNNNVNTEACDNTDNTKIEEQVKEQDDKKHGKIGGIHSIGKDEMKVNCQNENDEPATVMIKLGPVPKRKTYVVKNKDTKVSEVREEGKTPEEIEESKETVGKLGSYIKFNPCDFEPDDFLSYAGPSKNPPFRQRNWTFSGARPLLSRKSSKTQEQCKKHERVRKIVSTNLTGISKIRCDNIHPRERRHSDSDYTYRVPKCPPVFDCGYKW